MKSSRYYASLIGAIMLVSPIIAHPTFASQTVNQLETIVVQVREDAYFRAGVNKLRRQDYQGAIKDFDRAIRHNRRNAQAYFARGVAYSYLENYQQAISDFDRAIQLNSRFAEAYINRGVAYGS